MKKFFRNNLLITLLLFVGSFITSCSNDSNTDSSIPFTDIVGTFEITDIVGNNTHSWLQKGQYMTFNANGTCSTGFSMEDSWKNENGVIKTFYKETDEPMYIYTLLSRKGTEYEVQMKGTINDNTSLKITLRKVENVSLEKLLGVWSDGKHFISINSDNYLASYAGYNFIDCGNFSINGITLSSYNAYFNKQTIYQVKSLSESRMEVKVSYTDVSGESKEADLVLSKLPDEPAKENHQLSGKILSFRTSSFGMVTYNFSTFNAGTKTSTTSNCSKYPLSFFYIYINGKAYLQQFTNKTGQVPTIGGWTTNANNGTIFVFQLAFDAGGSVTDFINVSDENL